MCFKDNDRLLLLDPLAFMNGLEGRGFFGSEVCVRACVRMFMLQPPY